MHSQSVDVVVISRDGTCVRREVEVLGQSVLSVRVNGVRALDLSCTCSDIAELVVGRLYSEGYIHGMRDIEGLSYDESDCTVDVRLSAEAVCLTAPAVEIVSTTGPSPCFLKPDSRAFDLDPYDTPKWSVDELFALRDLFDGDTPLHARTSGTHSCRLSLGGEVIYTAEDIGRHNALDKAIGYVLLNDIDIAKTVFFISGRIPIDMAVKAIRAKVPVLASKAAPTDEAVRLARAYGLGIFCFPDENQLRVFSGFSR